ncbi:28398_t:CDS:1, partial [Dentiscutata erythropus]
TTNNILVEISLIRINIIGDIIGVVDTGDIKVAFTRNIVDISFD